MTTLKIKELGFVGHDGNIFWSYGDNPYSFRENQNQIYAEKPVFGLKSPPGSIRDECLNAAAEIHQRWKNLVVLYSGGIDSEVALLSFHLQGLKVDTVIVDFNGYNRADVFWARKFCDKHSIPYRILNFNPLTYWENDLWADAHSISCTSPQIMVHCKLTELVGGYSVTGGGDSHLFRGKNDFFELTSEKWAQARWMLKKNIAGCPRFFQYTAALEAAFLFEPLIEQFVERGYPFYEFRRFKYLKPFIFHKHFNCELRAKLTGFESLHEICEDYRTRLRDSIPPQTSVSWSYKNARFWALDPVGATQLLPLTNVDLPEPEMRALLNEAQHAHYHWVR